MAHRLFSCSAGKGGIFSDQGWKPVSPALAGWIPIHCVTKEVSHSVFYELEIPSKMHSR